MMASVAVSREIMGAQYIDSVYAERYFQSGNSAKFFARIPFHTYTLKVRREEGYVLVPFSGASVAQQKKEYQHLFNVGESTYLYEDESFYNDVYSPGWRLVKRDLLESSIGKKRSERNKDLPVNHKVISPALLLFTMISCFEAMKVKLFENVFAQTNTVLSDGSFVCFRWTKKGILICTDSGIPEYDRHVGVAVERSPSE